MKEERMHRYAGALMMSLMLLGVLSPRWSAVANLPDDLVIRTGGEASVQVILPMSAEVMGESRAVSAQVHRESVNLTAGEESGTAEVVFRLLGVVPVKTVKVTVEAPRMLIPGGRSLGVALETDGVVVVGASDLGTVVSPARKAGLRPGDVIQSVNGRDVEDAKSLSGSLADGEKVRLGVLRDGEEIRVDVLPKVDPRDGAYKLGAWVRNSTAGVGTLTFYDPADQSYGALGHAITDADTGVLFPVGEGAVYDNRVVRVTRGEKGHPGELTGEFLQNRRMVGAIGRNTPFGIFGEASEAMAEGGLYPEGLPAARREEIHCGKAKILSTVDGGGVRAYDCEIEKLYARAKPSNRSMLLHITDPDLLGQTGGIVQGMSGSPILQDGRVIGAVTHVLVDDPTRGYGVFIETMLDAAS